MFPSSPVTLPPEDVLQVFRYYQELNTIWNGIPSFNSSLVSSKPNVNHTQSLLKIVKKRPGTSASDEEHEGETMEEGHSASGAPVAVVPSMDSSEEHGDDHDLDIDIPAANDDTGFVGDNDEDMEDVRQVRLILVT